MASDPVNVSPHDVSTLQLQLKLTGDYPGLLHGILDGPTHEALVRFQGRENVGSTPGVIDADTCRALDHRAYATFDQQLHIEVDELARARPPELKTTMAAPDADSVDAAHAARFVGLAFSGGGIRSATFNLGVLQALSELRLLHLFDYLSTVSGGGYIGSWLSALIARRGGDINRVESEISPRGSEFGAPGYSRESPAIRFLRSYSNYLTPRLGLFSADMLSAVATYLRNLYLNLSILILILIAVLLVPRILVASTRFLSEAGTPIALLGVPFIWWGLVLMFVPTSLIVGANLAYRTPAPGAQPPWYAQTPTILGLFWAPGGLGAYLVSYWFSLQRLPGLGHPSTWWTAVGGALALAGWLFGALGYVLAAAPWLGTAATRPSSRHRERITYSLLAALVAGALGGVLFYWFTELLAWIQTDYGHEIGEWFAVGLGTIAVMKLLAVVVALHVGLVGRSYSEDVREWWSRLGGSAIAFGTGWVTLFLIAVYVVPPIAAIAQQGTHGSWLTGGAFGTWVASTIAGVLLGKGEKTGAGGGPNLNRVREVVARVAPYVFILGLLVGLSIVIDWVLPLLSHPIALCGDAGESEGFAKIAKIQFCQMDVVPLAILVATAGACLATGLVLSWRVDINLFSLYNFYRYRLTRCYLGATRAPHRQPQPFTGFDPGDDVSMHTLLTKQGPTNVVSQRPYHIVNTALNLVHGKDLEWQQRKAASFTFTPKFSGFELPPTAESAEPAMLSGTRANGPSARGCFRPSARTMKEGGAQLGAAIAISGAAASPNMGYHSAPALAFLMTVFNVRLGRWCGNPTSDDAWRQGGPGLAAKYLFYELVGLTTSTTPYVYLSDGGHFENLGLYELVRRRCRFIVACDAGQDEKLAFEDLGNAIRKCYADLGIPIELDVAPLRQRGESKRSEWHCAVGAIRYDLRDPDATPGVVLYLKPSLVGDEPADVLHYAATDPAFPHQSTNDQWFDEPQFESYRKLGHHIGMCALAKAKEIAQANASGVADGLPGSGFRDVEGLIVALRQLWRPPPFGGAEAFTRHTATLDSIYERLRTDPHLRFLDAQIYPELARARGRNPRARAVSPVAAERLRGAARRILSLQLGHATDGERLSRSAPRDGARPSGQPGLDESVQALGVVQHAPRHLGRIGQYLWRAIPGLLQSEARARARRRGASTASGQHRTAPAVGQHQLPRKGSRAGTPEAAPGVSGRRRAGVPLRSRRGRPPAGRKQGQHAVRLRARRASLRRQRDRVLPRAGSSAPHGTRAGRDA